MHEYRGVNHMKVIVIGCTHAGTTATKEILKQHPGAEVVIYERNDNVSFLSCGIALHLSGEVADINGLFYSSPAELAELGAEVHMQHNVTAVDTAAKTVAVTDMATGESLVNSYDKLVVTTGSVPLQPKLPGIDHPGLFLCKNFHDAKQLFEKAHDDAVKDVVIIGAGYIGVELIEAYEKLGKKVTVIDAGPRILNKYFDAEYTDRLTADFERRGVVVKTDELVQSFSGDDNIAVTTDKGTYEADLVILGIGFRPNTELLTGQVDMLPNGAIKTNEYMQTSQPDVFAAGDSATVHYNPTQSMEYIPLATNAVRQGKLIGINLTEPKLAYLGTQSSSGLKIYDDNMVASGLTKESAEFKGLDVESVTIEDNYQPEFMSSTTPVLMTLVWERTTHRIIGAQFMSKHDISQSANAISIAIQNKNTIEDLAFVDMLFQPQFDRPFNYVNLLGQAAMEAASK